MSVAYMAERSIEDELTRASQSDVVTIAISYCIMFAYIAIALGQARSFSRLLVSKFLTSLFFFLVFIIITQNEFDQLLIYYVMFIGGQQDYTRYRRCHHCALVCRRIDWFLRLCWCACYPDYYRSYPLLGVGRRC